MKLSVVKLAFTVVLAAISGTAVAQNWGPEWGENATQEERQQNVLMFNYYKDAYENKNYDLALDYYRQLLVKAPKSRQNLYVYAGNIYKTRIQQSRSLTDKNAYIDTLMSVYDKRIEFFGDDKRYGRDYLLVQKAKDFLNFKPADREGMREMFSQAIDANANNLSADNLALINIFFKELTDDYKQEMLDMEEYLEYYEKYSTLMAKATGPSADEARTTFDALFIQSEAADCDSIERIYKTRVADNPNDTSVLQKAFTQLKGLNCSSSFFFQVGEKYFAAEPLSSTAMTLAKAYEKVGNLRKSKEYLTKAVDIEPDPIAKANLCVEISGMEINANNGRSAADFARMALRYNPQNGYAYMFLAQGYAIGAAECADFDRQSVYWLAVDELQKARRIFSGSRDDLNSVNELIGAFSANFPATEELFFRGLKVGDSYDVKCNWVTGKTTIKERP